MRFLCGIRMGFSKENLSLDGLLNREEMLCVCVLCCGWEGMDFKKKRNLPHYEGWGTLF